MIGIYKITNKINNFSYIGQSVQIEERFKEHKTKYNWMRETNKRLYQAIQEFGIENFTFEILEECPSEELDSKEAFWIDYFNSKVDGYNATVGNALKK